MAKGPKAAGARFPTADDVARAILAACRETGEDPLAVASGKIDQRARHYALNALKAIFPDARSRSISRMCGGPAYAFYSYSRYKVFRVAKWWDESAFERVLAATSTPILQGDEPLPLKIGPLPPVDVARQEREAAFAALRPPCKQSAPVERPPPPVEPEPAPEPEPDTSDIPEVGPEWFEKARLVEPPRKPPAPPKPAQPAAAQATLDPSKKSLYAMLQDAVRNTAAMQPKEDDT